MEIYCIYCIYPFRINTQSKKGLNSAQDSLNQSWCLHQQSYWSISLHCSRRKLWTLETDHPDNINYYSNKSNYGLKLIKLTGKLKRKFQGQRSFIFINKTLSDTKFCFVRFYVKYMTENLVREYDKILINESHTFGGIDWWTFKAWRNEKNIQRPQSTFFKTCKYVIHVKCFFFVLHELAF